LNHPSEILSDPPRIAPAPDALDRPLVSVMIPTYNSGNLLRETLKSVLVQDPGPDVMEIHVIDNCSTKDDPEAIVRKIGSGRVRFTRQSINVGPIENFNACIRHSRGTWVHILHADDTVRPGFYDRLRQATFSHPQMDAFACRIIYMDGEGAWIGLTDIERRDPDFLEDRFIRRQFQEQRIQFVGIVVRRSVYEELGGFRPELPHCTDWDMWNRVAVRQRIYYDPEPLACYRLHDGAATSAQVRTGQNVVDERRCIAQSLSYLPVEFGRMIYREAMREAGIRAVRRVRNAWSNGQRDVAIRQLKEALRCSVSPSVLARMFYVLAAIIEGKHVTDSLSLRVPRQKAS
jgi:glycosyltransferase involved in cell wall biosynthesis